MRVPLLTVLLTLACAAPAVAQAPVVPAPPAPPAPAPAPAWPQAAPEPVVRTTGLAVVPGREAVLRTDGRAAIPHDAPKQVRALVRSLNEIAGKPYKWGGGHAKLLDAGYDCSGSVSYGLIRTGLLAAPLVSGGFAKAYAHGEGRWVTLYANADHVYMEVAGLRLDTSPVADPTGQGDGVRWRPAIGRRPGFAARHPLGL